MILKNNKSFEVKDMDYINSSPLASELKDLVDELTEKRLITTATGNLKQSNLNERIKYEYTLNPMRLWGYVRTIEVCDLKPEKKALDGGGASSPIIFYLGKKGIDITTLDIQGSLVENTKEIALKMGWGKIKSLKKDMTNTGFPDNYFDSIFSISVLQNLPQTAREKAVKEFARILKPGGIVGLIFDFGKSTGKKENYKYKNYESFHSPLSTIEEIKETIINPSGLDLYGNCDLTAKISRDKSYIRKTYFANLKERKNLRSFLAALRSLFYAPSFHYGYYSIFLKKN